MNTRAEVEVEFDVVADTIKDPGKFEGEAWYAPIVYDWVMDGGGDTHGPEGQLVDFFELSDDDRSLFGTDAYGVSLYVSETGFVYVTEYTRLEYEREMARLDSYEEELNEDGCGCTDGEPCEHGTYAEVGE